VIGSTASSGSGTNRTIIIGFSIDNMEHILMGQLEMAVGCHNPYQVSVAVDRCSIPISRSAKEA
jgi:hypothetical protein